MATLAVLGAPIHLGSLSGGRFDLAPEAVRRALAAFSTWTGDGDVRTVRARDLGDAPVGGLRPEEAFEPLASAVRWALSEADAVVLLGGDNSVTRAGVHGVGVPLERVGLLTLDAHLDLRDTAGGLTNGNPVRALLEDGLPGDNVVQVGIQPFANAPAYAAVAGEAGIRTITADEARHRGVRSVVEEALGDLARRTEAVYVDLDVDVLDRALAPASPGARPGGLLPADLRAAARACGLHPSVRVVDVVEVDPARDVADVTALAGAACLLEVAAGVAERAPR